jgi:hypothetical protein
VTLIRVCCCSFVGLYFEPVTQFGGQNDEPVTLLGGRLNCQNPEPVTLLREVYREPVTLSEASGGAAERGNE